MYQYSFNSVHLLLTCKDFSLPALPIVNVPDQAQIFTVGRRAPTKHDVMGARGEMNVATTVNYSGVLSFPLMQTAPENLELSTYQIRAEKPGAASLLGKAPIEASLVDATSAFTIGSMTGGYIQGPPAIVRGNTINYLVWSIVFELTTLRHGGNIPTPDTNLTNYLVA